jgi:hypothetical protein
MRIYGPNGTTLGTPASQARRTGSGTFVLPDTSSAQETRSAAAPKSATNIDGLLALQGVEEDPVERRKRSVARGRTALDVLDDLKMGLLSGNLDASTVMRLRDAAANLKSSSGDAGLDAVLAEIELRVEVELAKAGQAYHSSHQLRRFLLLPRVVAALGGENVLQILLGPIAQRIDRAGERQPELRDRILDRHGHGRDGMAPEQAVAFERFEDLAQHLLPFDRAAQLIEAHRLLAQQQEDQHRPFVADPVEDLASRAVRCVDVGFHRRSSESMFVK